MEFMVLPWDGSWALHCLNYGLQSGTPLVGGPVALIVKIPLALRRGSAKGGPEQCPLKSGMQTGFLWPSVRD